MKGPVLASALLGASVIGAAALVSRGVRWGATGEEQAMRLPGDAYLEGGPAARTMMTRAISISAPPAVVWPWVAQLGRGAGWYSYDRIDNGGKPSAEHIVSWIPEPAIGDAAAIGWLCAVESGRALTWWLPGEATLGTTMRMVVDIRLEPERAGSRLIIRVSGDAAGAAGFVVKHLFQIVDSIMAIRQLRGIKVRAEEYGARTGDPGTPETGDRDQFQLYETIWASGGRAGSAGRERAEVWRRAAEAAGALG